MREVVIVDAIRTPIGKYKGALKDVRPDDLGAIVIKALIDRNTGLPQEEIEDVIFGNANGAGEDNRNVARMSLLLAGLPECVSGTTINRLCGSGLDAVSMGARSIIAGEADIIIAGGTESMTRAPFVMGKPNVLPDKMVSIGSTQSRTENVFRLLEVMDTMGNNLRLLPIVSI